MDGSRPLLSTGNIRSMLLGGCDGDGPGGAPDRRAGRHGGGRDWARGTAQPGSSDGDWLDGRSALRRSGGGSGLGDLDRRRNSTSLCSFTGTSWVPSDLIGSSSRSRRRSSSTPVCSATAWVTSAAVTEPNSLPSDPARAEMRMTAGTSRRAIVSADSCRERAGGHASVSWPWPGSPRRDWRRSRSPWGAGSCGRTRRPPRRCHHACPRWADHSVIRLASLPPP